MVNLPVFCLLRYEENRFVKLITGWQFPGNCLQIANYDRHSNFEAIFEMPCLLTFRKAQKITHSTQKRVFNLLFFKATKKTLGADFFCRPMKWL